ncbi:MAG: prolipoprotein diacylglyceryl transferase [Clostridiaceae bacterium]|nr:prolipoprotein diacylglyceryl transferase [Clostridiaceae bacterium]
MFPTYNIFDYTFASYGTLILLGLLVGIGFSVLQAKRYQPELQEDVFFSSLFGVIGVGIGGKLLYILINIPEIINLLRSDLEFHQTMLILLQGGFVFYGSLIGAFLGLYIYSKAFNISCERILFYLTPAVPLIHAFGRIGCFAAGCCYGVPCDRFGYIFINSPIAPNGIRLFPTQLLEAGFCLIIFIIIMMFFKRINNGYYLFAIYGIMYSLFRFIIELFRGDIERGFVGFLSTSQIISLFIFVIALIYLYRDKDKLVQIK